MAVCIMCARNLHDECYWWDIELNRCCCESEVEEIIEPIPDITGNTGARDGMAWSKHDGNIVDAKSTGRKRAAKLYPLEPSMPCEWRGLYFAGGGMYPIIGCKAGLQEHRHHGPDLSTLNNTEGNVHRICTTCHNRWHADNDGFILEFDGTIKWAKHDPIRVASAADIELANVDPTFSRSRYSWRNYSKDKHDYRDYLRNKEGSA